MFNFVTLIYDKILFFPFINILLFLYRGFLFLRIPFAFGFSIIALTALIRFALHPFFHKQTMMARKMAKIKPQLDHFSKKYKGDKRKLQEEQMKLYKEMGVNPASGCLFALIQMPIFIALYQVLSEFFMKGDMVKIVAKVNKIVYFEFLKITSIDPMFFGINLGIAPSQFQKYGWYYLIIPALTAFLQYMQVKVSTPASPISGKAVAVQKKEGVDDKKKDTSDMQGMMNTQMKYIFPVMIGWFSYTLPVGLSLYWNIFSLFSIIQAKKKIDI